MQDEYGRPLSDDGQWVWDGAAWRSTGGGAGAAPDPATAGLEPTRVAPQAGQPSGPQDYFAQPAPYGSSGPPTGGTGGPGVPPPQTPWWKRPSVIIGALLVLSAVLVTIILLTRSDGEAGAAAPTPSVTVTPSAAPTTDEPTPSPTTLAPTTPPPDTPSPTPSAPAPSQVTGGIYDCTQDGQSTGLTISISGLTYTTNTGAVGTYSYNPTSGAIAFTGGDLGPYTGTYNPAGPSMDIQASGIQLHCAL